MTPPPAIRACVFDAYGTLLDLESAIAAHRPGLGAVALPFLKLWRSKQLEYTWLRTAMERYAAFDEVTADALDYACEAFDIRDPPLRAGLLAAFERLSAYPDAVDALAALRRASVRTAVLSNGTTAMLMPAVEASGLAPELDRVLSVEVVRRYKPAPEVYALAVRELGAAPEELLFVSANAWDVAGAAAAGLVTVWINRAGAPSERLPFGAAHVIDSLSEVAALARRGSVFAE
jgi:2-haloacid dehalogenase